MGIFKIHFFNFKTTVLFIVLAFLNSCNNNPETLKDIDGNEYHTIKIGTQVWMAENLRTTHYRNGDPLPNLVDTAQWDLIPMGAYCNYNNDTGYLKTFGRLYNWYAVTDSRNIAPEGWHVPGFWELQTLINFLEGEALAGGKMKETGTIQWIIPNSGATNESGFSALPGGYRYNRGGSFHTIGSNGHWWTTAGSYEMYAWSQQLFYGFADINRNINYRNYGFSIRCIRDN